MKNHQFAIDGVEISVYEEGVGSPLLLVHGFPLDHTMWEYQIARFAKTHRVIAPDLRGFGQSGVTPGTVTMRKHADDLAVILDKLGETRPVIYCGLSMGGYVAWQFVEHYRTRVASLIVCDTRAAADTAEAAATRLKTAERLERENANGFLVETMIPKLFAPTTIEHHPTIVEATRKVMLGTDPRACAAAQRGMAERPDVRQRLAKIISVPTLVICGQFDALAPPAEMKEIAAAIPGARYVEATGVGHMAPLESPELVNAMIAEFLRR